jgi:hypothetical protein
MLQSYRLSLRSLQAYLDRARLSNAKSVTLFQIILRSNDSRHALFSLWNSISSPSSPIDVACRSNVSSAFIHSLSAMHTNAYDVMLLFPYKMSSLSLLKMPLSHITLTPSSVMLLSAILILINRCSDLQLESVTIVASVMKLKFSDKSIFSICSSLVTFTKHLVLSSLMLLFFILRNLIWEKSGEERANSNSFGSLIARMCFLLIYCNLRGGL